MRLTNSLSQLTGWDHEVVVIGSGPAATAVVERIYSESASKITVLERGPLMLTTHFNNLLPNSHRRKFIDTNGCTPWVGTMIGGLLMVGLGGRGTVAGAHRPRFYEEDFVCFADGKWPQDVVEALPALFSLVEGHQSVVDGDISCPAQEWASNALDTFRPAPPRISLDKSSCGFRPSRGYDSPAERLVGLAALDSMSAAPRLRIVTDCYVTRILHDGNCAISVCCLDTQRRENGFVKIATKKLVLAASPVESARLVLNSGLAQDRPAVGRFLAEHMERRCKVRVYVPEGAGRHDGISLVVPPCGAVPDQRFQIHLRGEPDPSDKRCFIVDIGGFAAMEPKPINRVTLAGTTDEFGILKAETHLTTTAADRARERNMCLRMEAIVDKLGGRYITERFPLESGAPRYTDESRRIEVMAPGRSYHEAGTLRIGTSEANSACNTAGRLHGMENLYVADASLFPCVGVANPILTLSAMAYWVSDGISLHAPQANACAKASTEQTTTHIKVLPNSQDDSVRSGVIRP